jgi:PAS domain-containing protein
VDESDRYRNQIPESADLTASIEAIRSQTRLLRSIIESIGDGLVVADRNGKFLIFNPIAERILGMGALDVPPAEWVAKYGVFQVDGVTPLAPEALPLSRALRGEESDQVELFIRNTNVPDGVYISVTGRPLYDADGAVNGGVIVFRDVTDRKRQA